ncbi:HEPN domain-containing protein [candidate division KSB1 bacterium]|nr:HEPN domain-containing protein [candidate division KSB1 bacterium]NIS23880.1 HEPN domain-containing protein [candidate division KSB1 bacterium]NIT72510.1 HEPN domain-containing protein [candidate division KSB1 bacterium]NIU24529.1 HEPN domain-containing protein [candidate division KSB1 bacterium]NIU94474.1 HEPN domain-containing protein [candidate division KSB1 bacterium]
MDIDKVARAWRRSSQEDLRVARSLHEKKHYAYCLFFCHLAVEKELKRIYLLRCKEMPPFIYNLIRIADECDLQLDNAVRKDLQELTTFNIKARYEIVKTQFHRKATKSYTEKWLRRTEQILELLKKSK